MAGRNYAHIRCAIWDDPEFLALSEAAQRAYFLLITQSDISAAGVLRMWTPRWAAMSRTSTEESLKSALHELKVAHYIVPDWVTGELLVRSFVKWDGGYNNQKRRPVIIREACAVRSRVIRQALRVEFEKLNLPTDGLPEPPPPTGPDRAWDRASDAGRDSDGTAIGPLSGSMTDGIRSAIDTDSGLAPEVAAESTVIVAFPQVDRLSDTAPHGASHGTSPSIGVVGTTEVTTGNPQPHNPKPEPPTADAAASRGTDLARIDATSEINSGHVVAAWAETFTETGNRPTKQQRGQVGREAKELLEAGNDPHRVLAAARELGRKGRATLVAELAIQSTQTDPRPERRTAYPALEWQRLKTGTGGGFP